MHDNKQENQNFFKLKDLIFSFLNFHQLTRQEKFGFILKEIFLIFLRLFF